MKKIKKVSKRRSLGSSLESLEERDLLAADAGFVISGGELYFEITGSSNDDTIELVTEADGDVTFTHNSTALVQSGEVEADDISLAELITGADFAGFSVKGDDGDDILDASALTNYSVVLSGEADDDTLLGGTKSDELIGGPGMDTLNGFNGNDSLSGGPGMDWLYGGNGHDSLIGGDGNDSMDGGRHNDVLRGGDGHDFIVGGVGSDAMYGGKDNDTLVADPSDSLLRGFGGNDTLLLDAAAEANMPGVGFDLRNFDIETIDVGWDYTYDIPTKSATQDSQPLNDDIINSTTYSGPGYAGGNSGVHVSTGRGDDLLRGSAQNDSLHAGADNDIVIGNAGADTMDGGNGIDTLEYVTSAVGVDVDMDDPTSPHYATYPGYGTAGDAAGDRFIDFENLGGSKSDDVLEGDDDDNIIRARAGDDIVYGQAGTDVIFGSNGDDWLYGGDDDDFLFGSNGDDFISGDEGEDSLSGANGLDTLVFHYVGGADVIDDSFVFGGVEDDIFRALDVGMSTNEFAIRSALQDASRSDFDANDDDELELVL